MHQPILGPGVTTINKTDTNPVSWSYILMGGGYKIANGILRKDPKTVKW